MLYAMREMLATVACNYSLMNIQPICTLLIAGAGKIWASLFETKARVFDNPQEVTALPVGWLLTSPLPELPNDIWEKIFRESHPSIFTRGFYINTGIKKSYAEEHRFLQMRKECLDFLANAEQHDFFSTDTKNKFLQLEEYYTRTLTVFLDDKNSVWLAQQAAHLIQPFFKHLTIEMSHRGAGKFVADALKDKKIDFFERLADIDLYLALYFMMLHCTSLERADKIDFIARRLDLNARDAQNVFNALQSSQPLLHRLVKLVQKNSKISPPIFSIFSKILDNSHRNTMNICDENGNTLLIIATAQRQGQLVEWLLAHGANATIVNHIGETASSIRQNSQIRQSIADNKTIIKTPQNTYCI